MDMGTSPSAWGRHQGRWDEDITMGTGLGTGDGDEDRERAWGGDKEVTRRCQKVPEDDGRSQEAAGR